jgi:Uma2 family endonuclease
MFATMPYTELPQGVRIKQLRVEDVYRLRAAGAFDDDERVELLHGVLVVMEPVGGPHIWITQRLMKRLLIAALDLPVEVICQSAIRMGDFQLPQPDITVVPKQMGFDPPAGGLLVVEVSDTSLAKDRDTKSRIYAMANVPEYWIVDVDHEQVHVFTDPHGTDYRQITIVPRSGKLQPIKLPEISIEIDQLFRIDD